MIHGDGVGGDGLLAPVGFLGQTIILGGAGVGHVEAGQRDAGSRARRVAIALHVNRDDGIEPARQGACRRSQKSTVHHDLGGRQCDRVSVCIRLAASKPRGPIEKPGGIYQKEIRAGGHELGNGQMHLKLESRRASGNQGHVATAPPEVVRNQSRQVKL